jgi:hypothetical protein
MQRLVIAWLLAILIAPECSAYSARRPSPLIGAIPLGTEGVGCYWERGRQFCARYCYVEVDGHRFCREREREAFSQAPLIELPAQIQPMK